MIKLNTSSLVAVHLASVQVGGKVLGDVATGGGGITPLPPSIPDEPEPPVEPDTKTYTLSASVSNGVVSATLNGSAISLPYEANEGDVIVVSVEPNDGFSFDGWADGNTDNPRSITMASDVVLSAECIAVPSESKYIQFEDKNVEAICVANWSSDGIGLTMEDAAAVTSIGTTFKGNTAITSFDELQYFTGVTFLGTDNSNYNGGAFNGCTNLRTITLPKSVTTIRNGSFMNCTSLRTIGGLENVEEIRNQAFHGCSQWNEDVELPSLTSLATTTFTNSGITGFNAPRLTIIAGYDNYNYGVFTNCDSLTKVSIPMVADVGRVAFSLCDSLEEIELPSATTIGGMAFYGCSKLKKIICRTTTPPTLGAVSAFSSTHSDLVIYVPDASLEAYKTATNWNTYADRIKPLSEIEGIKRVRFNDTGVSLEYFPTENDALEMDFEDIEYINDMHYFGKPESDGRGYTMTIYNRKYYFGADGGERNGGVWVVGRKLIQYNVGQGNNVFINGQQIGAYSSVGEHYSEQHLYVGLRSSNPNLNGYLYSFRIYDKTTGEDKVRLKPVIHDGIVQFYDEVRDLYLSYILGNPLTIE